MRVAWAVGRGVSCPVPRQWQGRGRVSEVNIPYLDVCGPAPAQVARPACLPACRPSLVMLRG